MLTPNADGYLLAVTLFLVCCWVNPNDAIPHRTRRQAEEVDQRVGDKAETSAVNVAEREIGQPDPGVDKKPALSGGGKKWRYLQHPQNSRSRQKNVNVNINSFETGSISRLDAQLSKNEAAVAAAPILVDSSTSIESLAMETINCSEPHKPKNKYSTSFSENSTLQGKNIGEPDFEVVGETTTKKTTSVHVGEDVTLCWIETTTIKEDHSFEPVQRLVIREYTISFENSASIPELYLECVKVEGEVDGHNDSVPVSKLFEVIDENTRHSRVVNFTTVSHYDTLTVYQHKRVRCGMGPVLTKNIIEWSDELSDIPKKRVEIKVSPETHKLSAHPTVTEPCTDLVDLEPTSTTPMNPEFTEECGPGTTCETYSQCVDDNCEISTSPNEESTTSFSNEENTQSYMTTSSTDMDTTTNTKYDQESTEPLTTGVTDEPPLVTDESTTSISLTLGTSPDDDHLFTETPLKVTTLETIVPAESSTPEIVTLFYETSTGSIEIGNQEVDTSSTPVEINFSESTPHDSCGNGDSCPDSFESTTASRDDWSVGEQETTGISTVTGSVSLSTEEFTAAMSTTDVSSTQITEFTFESEEDYSSREEIITTTDSGELPVTVGTEFTSTESTENNSMTESTMISARITDTMESSIATTDATESTTASMTPTQYDLSTDDYGQTTEHEQCDEGDDTANCRPLSDGPEVTTETVEVEITDGTETTTIITTETDLPQSNGITDESTTSGKEMTTEEITTGISDATTEMMTLSTKSGGETTAGITDTTTEVTLLLTTFGDESASEETTSGISDATTEVTTLSTSFLGESSMERTTTEISDGNTEVTTFSTPLGDESITEATTTRISDSTTEGLMVLTTFGDESSTERTTTQISDGNTEVTTFSTTLRDELVTEGSTTCIDAAIEVTTSTTSSGGELTTEGSTSEIADVTTEVTMLPTTLGGELTTEGSTSSIIDETIEVTTLLTTLGAELTTEENITEISDATTEVTTLSTLLGGDSTTKVTTDAISDANTEDITLLTTLSGKLSTMETVTEISDATSIVMTLSTTMDGELTTEATTPAITDATTGVMTLSTTSGGELNTEITTTGVNDATTEVTTLLTTVGGELTAEGTTFGINDLTTEVTERLVTENDETDATVFSTTATTRTSTEIYPGESSSDVYETTTETTTNITDSNVDETTDTVIFTTREESDFETTTSAISDLTSVEFTNYIHESTTNVEMSTHNEVEGSTESTTETVAVSDNEVKTTGYSTVPTTQIETTTSVSENDSSRCDPSTGDCDTTETVDVTPIILNPCENGTESCVSRDYSTNSVCDKESGECSLETTSVSPTLCDEESGDCSVISTTISPVTCSEESNPSCTATTDNERFTTSSESSETYADNSTEPFITPVQTGETTDVPRTTSSTPTEVENTPTTVSDVATTVENGSSTTIKMPSDEPETKHKLALSIKLLLEHIDEKKNKQKLVEIEKYLLFDEHPDQHGNNPLINQLKLLNNTITRRTVQELFNCSKVEKLTGDLSLFAPKYLSQYNGIQNLSNPEELREHKPRDLGSSIQPELDPNVEMSLPGIHDDIHSGLNHVMARVPSENGVDQQSAEDISRSRILEVVADPQDKRVQRRRKRQTIEDLTIDEKDLPKDVEKVGHWSKERVKRALNGGHIRSFTEFTIYKGPSVARHI